MLVNKAWLPVWAPVQQTKLKKNQFLYGPVIVEIIKGLLKGVPTNDCNMIAWRAVSTLAIYNTHSQFLGERLSRLWDLFNLI